MSPPPYESGEIQTLAAELAHAEPEIRRLAAQRLRELPGEEVAPLLLHALADDEWRVRKEAVSSAVATAPRPPVVSALVTALAESSAIGLRNAAVEALVGIGSSAVPAVIVALGKLDADGRKLALEVLAGVPDARAIDALIRSLADGDPNVRATAAEGLAVAALAGDPPRSLAVEALLAIACAKDELFVRFAALEALKRLDAEVPWSTLEVLLADPITRRHALALAAQSDGAEALGAMARALGDANTTLAMEALTSLAFRLEDEEAMGGPPEKIAGVDAALADKAVRSRLRAWAEDEQMSTRIRGAALVTLGRVRDTADVTILAAALGNEQLSVPAELGLRLFGEDAVGPMIAASRAAPPIIRGATFSIVPVLAPAHIALTMEDDLHRALVDRSADVRASALRTLAHLGTAEDLLRAARLVTDTDPHVAAAASTALGSLAALHPDAARALVATTDPTMQGAAAGCIALAALLRNGDDATGEQRTFLQRALTHGDTRVRAAALAALGLASGDDALDAVSFALADEESDVALAAIRALAEMKAAAPLIALLTGTTDPTLIAPLLMALAEADPQAGYQAALVRLSSTNPAVATAAVRAAARAESAHREGALSLALAHPDQDVVKAALAELARIGTKSAAVHLGTAFDNGSWEVRRFAAELLATLPAGDAHLRARLEVERDPSVRDAIAGALANVAANVRTGPREG